MDDCDVDSIYIGSRVFGQASPSLPAASFSALQAQEALSRRINRIALVNQALIEILCERFGVTEREIVDKVMQIDLRDGIRDSQFTAPPEDCPECDVKICREFERCLFCGHADEATALLQR